MACSAAFLNMAMIFLLTLSEKNRIVDLENEAKDGVYVAPSKIIEKPGREGKKAN